MHPSPPQEPRLNQTFGRVLVTGGAGFIGSNLVRQLVCSGVHVLNFDKLSYAGHTESLSDLDSKPNHEWCIADLCNSNAITKAIQTFQPNAVVHLAAESHVDRSIESPGVFALNNVLGTVNLLQSTYDYWRNLSIGRRESFRFLQVSTDEVYGQLPESGSFSESSSYQPNSPYAASKASADHFARAFHHTYNLPLLISNCSNNYGPYQHPEKLIPVVITHALQGMTIPVYGNGENVRDWLHVADHCNALITILDKAVPGSNYIIGARNEIRNQDLVSHVCQVLDMIHPRTDGKSYQTQIVHVPDRLGHDYRYSVDPNKIERELGWHAGIRWEQGIQSTVEWYLLNQQWWKPLITKVKAGRQSE